MENNVLRDAGLDINDIMRIETVKVEEEQGIQMEDLFQTALDDLNDFDDKAWNKGDGLALPSYPYITEHLEGLDSGLYLFAGRSNHGKSAIMMNLLYDLCSHQENKIYGLYYSLDDSRNEIIPRLIAMDQSIPIGVAAKPRRYQNMIDQAEEGASVYIEMLEKRQQGLDRLKTNSNRLKIEDSNKIKNIEDMYEHIKKTIVYLKAFDPDFKIVIAIDSINDVTLNYKPQDNDILGETAKRIKHWTVEFDCPIFASTHIRKLNGNRRPTLDDLKDSTVLVYESSVVWIVYNDVSENKEGANIYAANSDGKKFPIIEIDWAKNKKSSYKGRSFCFFRPEYSRTVECDKNSIIRYNAQILAL